VRACARARARACVRVSWPLCHRLGHDVWRPKPGPPPADGGCFPNAADDNRPLNVESHREQALFQVEFRFPLPLSSQTMLTDLRSFLANSCRARVPAENDLILQLRYLRTKHALRARQISPRSRAVWDEWTSEQATAAFICRSSAVKTSMSLRVLESHWKRFDRKSVLRPPNLSSVVAR
jgi:hypothetical protein